MRFALLGNHPDGLQLAVALVATGRHELQAYSGPKVGSEELAGRGLPAPSGGDLEEILADPAVDLVVVAGKPAERALQLRRALQSERHVLCVQPADESPDIAYEAGMIQGDTKKILLPVLSDSLHPAVRRLAELLQASTGALGTLRFLQLEQTAPTAVLLDAQVPGHDPGLPCWSLLRALGGEVVEVSAFAAGEALAADAPLLLAGTFQGGGLFQVTLLPGQERAERRLRVHGTQGTAELLLAAPTEPTILSWRIGKDPTTSENFAPWNPWAAVLTIFEQACAPPPATTKRPLLTWQDAVRSLELDDAARRSVERRRASTLDYQEVSEEVGFKGTMTLVGCGLLWGTLVIVILAAWDRRWLWLIGPLLAIFLGLQLLRWVIPQAPPADVSHPTDTNDRLRAG